MIFKDCLYGQIRKLHAGDGLTCLSLPNDISSIIPKQEVVTWDNTTGMNPLWDSMPEFTVATLSYGKMLETSWDMNSVWLKELTNNVKFTADEFEALVREDYTNECTLLCKRLSMWWLIDYFLNRPDVLDYDYIIVRQVDTVIQPDCNAEQILDEMATSNQKIFKSDHVPAGIPVCYDLSRGRDPQHHSSTMITSHAFILNREAVIILKDNFYQLVLNEIDHYYNLLGADNFLDGDPGGILHRICVKQTIESLSLQEIYMRPEDCRIGDKGGTVNYSNLDRSGV